MQYDIFISYSIKNNANNRVTELKELLEEEQTPRQCLSLEETAVE